MMRTSCGMVVLVGALVCGVTPTADAATILAVDINGSQACAADNNVGCTFGLVLSDLDPTLSVLSLGTSVIGGVEVEGSLHTASVSATGNLLSSGSLAITNLLASTAFIQASIGATDFVGPTSFAQATGSGTWIDAAGSSTTYSYYNDPTNTQGADTATDRPGIEIASFSDIAGAGLDSFAFDSGAMPFIDPAQFSMTLGFDMTLLGFDRLESRGQAEFKDLAVSEIPEPLSLILLGTGLVGGYLRRRHA